MSSTQLIIPKYLKMSLRDMMERRPHWVFFFFAPKLYVIPFKAMSMDLDHPKFGPPNKTE